MQGTPDRLALWFDCWQRQPTLIAPDDTWCLWGIILAGTAGAIWLEQTYRWASKASGPVLALLGAMLLSNFKTMPTEAPTYEVISEYLVPVAIPLLLLRANVLRIVRETGWMLVAFHVSCLGTLLGTLLAAWIFSTAIDQVPEIAGIMTGSYSGGAVNFFACKESFQVGSNLTNPLLVADNFIMAGMFAVLLLISGSRFFLNRYAHPHSAEADGDAGQSAAATYWSRKEVGLLDIATALAIALAIAAVSSKLSAMILSFSPWKLAGEVLGNKYLLITFFSVAVATIFHRRLQRLGGSDELGAYLLYIFFFAIGLPADLVTVVVNVPLMFLFCLVIAVVNLVVTLGVGRWLRLDLEELLLCVNATLGGAPSAAAMAIAKGWPKLVLPALLVGIWGYVIGTFLGVLVGKTLVYWSQ